MEALLASPGGVSTETRIEVHFALGKAFADAGQFEPSFRHLRLGNALKRVNIAYDEAGTLGIMKRLQDAFSGELLDRRHGFGDPSSTPVFVVGMPRSGTTLIEQILASHPKVFGAGERHEFHRIAVARGGAGIASAALPEQLSLLADDGLRRLGAEYAAAIGALAPNASRVVDKMPGNFLHVGLIALALPNARIIHVSRDPVDTCVSCFATLFSGEQPYAYNLAELGRYYRAYDALMRHWRDVVPSGVMLEVRYEDIVDDLESQARAMIAHCGLEWDAACLEFHRTKRSVRTASKAQVRQPLYRSAVGRAKAYGPMLAPLLQALGREQ
jgi:hypothetical protein